MDTGGLPNETKQRSIELMGTGVAQRLSSRAPVGAGA